MEMTLRMPRLHAGQERIRRSRARFKAVACGRRFGKTYLGAQLCVADAAPGGTTWWVSPSYKQSKIAWRVLRPLTEQIPGTRYWQSPDYRIEFPTGGSIQIHTTGSGTAYDTLRGEGLTGLVIDECADVPEMAYREALEPSLMDKKGWGLFMGTPKGRNWFHRMWVEAHRFDDWEAFQMPSHANPLLDPRELARLEARTPGRIWRQEYLAEFVTFEGRVYENFTPAGPMVFRGEVNPKDYEQFFAGIDFGFRNPTAIVVAGRTKEGRLDVVDELYQDRLKPEELLAAARRLQDRYSIASWWGDAADPRMIEFMADDGIPIEASPRTSGGQETFVQYEVRLVSGLLEEDPPALRFHEGNCPETIREHDSYRYPKRRADAVERESPLKVDDHSCLPPGSLISVPGGQRPIEHLSAGDSLLTHLGTGRILAITQTGIHRLILVRFEDGRWLVCTEDHPLAISGGGFIPAVQSMGREVDRCRLWKQLSMGARPGGVIPSRLTTRYAATSGDISDAAGYSDRSGFTGKSSKITSDRSQAAWPSTTGMVIQGTTLTETSNSSPCPSTRPGTAHSPNQRRGLRARHGTEAQPAGNGTASTDGEHSLPGEPWAGNVSIADGSSSPSPRTQDSADPTAVTRTDSPLEPTTKRDDVLSAVHRLSAIATARRSLARVGVEPSRVTAIEPIAGTWPVLNLATSDGTYFANGALTSNCNATQYLVHGLEEYFGTGGEAVFGGRREAYDLPT